MKKTYRIVTNDQRKKLIKLIHQSGLTIKKAAEMSGVYYPTAKAINKVFLLEDRIDKKKHRVRKPKICGRGNTSKSSKKTLKVQARVDQLKQG